MFFEAKARVDGNREWNALLIQGTNGGYDINDIISREAALDMAAPITMFLVNTNRDKKDRRHIPFEADLVYWSDDITYKAFRPRHGFAVIVSDAMKAVLDGFSMPPHRYHPVNLIKYEKREETWTYHLLQIFGSLYNIADYQASEFKYEDLKTRNLIETQKGGFIDYEAFKRKCSEMIDNNILLSVKSMVLTVEYDVMWGFNNSLLVSERAKEAMESKGLRDVQIEPFRKFEIH
ncbi:hypothetical protein [Chryseolinea soli]|uniref:Uncharacterized protein n=1 Tax=Chryseolinea soli TaxID=2321403 RepID=A0A385SST3_9BACT|nr:hypothetical protein [Chryseolinea soli]AYB34883.1 hypothetical protein D4L85_31785 [Chryseolinea soli]